MRQSPRPMALLLVFCVLLSLSGCYAGNIDQYFSLPRASEEYIQLQSLIDQELSSGSEYAAPTRGSYRQSVQLYDLTGDGVSEALAFFRDSDNALKVCIYDRSDGEYKKVLTLTGEGRSIGSVSFSDMDGDGNTDLLLSWQIASGMSLLSVYSLAYWSGDMLLSTACSEYMTGDYNADGRDELMILRSVNSGTYLADLYSFNRDREPQATSAPLSAGIYELRRIKTVYLDGNAPALLVESILENGDMVSDLLVCREGSLTNLTMNRTTGVSETRRSYSLIYAQDIDGDGFTEIPHPQRLYSRGDEVFWSIAWYRYDAAGRANLIMTTYHNVIDNWYLELPNRWVTGLTARREDTAAGERAVILSQLDTNGNANDLLAIYTITGENRLDWATQGDRFILLEETGIVYAAEILGGDVDRNTIQNLFHRIYSEWSPGSV